MPGRNDPCRCGSGAKYKRCCWGGDQFPARKRRDAQRAAGDARLAARDNHAIRRDRRVLASVLGMVAAVASPPR